MDHADQVVNITNTMIEDYVRNVVKLATAALVKVIIAQSVNKIIQHSISETYQFASALKDIIWIIETIIIVNHVIKFVANAMALIAARIVMMDITLIKPNA